MSRRVMALLLPAALVLAASAPAQRPTCDDAEHRQFDFWLGEWEVTTPDGSAAGQNRVSSILDGCVVHESWKGTSGSVGESFNLYDRSDGKWHQTWVDNSGNRLDLVGGLRDGAMVLEGTTPGDGEVKVFHRITWTRLEEGKVRQHWKTSRDGGYTWSDAFVGIYAKGGDSKSGGDDG